MSFDLDRFQNARFVPREADVEVPGLAPFFAEGVRPVFRVRGLTGQQLGFAGEALQRRRNLAAIVDRLASSDAVQAAGAVAEALGVADEIAQETAIRQEMLRVGLVSPVLDGPAVAKLCKAFPVEFRRLTDRINELSGEGHAVGESNGSGVATTSGPA